MNAIATRVLSTLFVLWGVCSITFLLLHLTPGDPVDIMLGENASVTDKAAFRHELGLDQSLGRQYGDYFTKLLHGDLGQSFIHHRPVMSEIFDAMPATIELAFASLVLAIIVSLPLGVFSASFCGGWFDRAVILYSLIGISTPSFWLAPSLIWIFSIKLDWLPVSERAGFTSIILPAISLAFGLSATILRMTRANLLEVLHENYIRVAQSKGLGFFSILFKHALKNALTPVITVLNLQLGAVLTGVVIIETIFDWPGLGILLFTALQERNYPLVQGCVVVIAGIYILVNLITDVAYVLVDPRLRKSRGIG